MSRWRVPIPGFYPGLKVTRWFALFGISAIVLLAGMSKFISDRFRGVNIPVIPEATLYRVRDYVVGLKFGDFLFIGLGLAGLVLAFRMIVRTVTLTFLPERSEEMVDLAYKRLLLRKGPRIVAIGGGTGLPVVLSGLKEYTSNITAVVTVADDGGSSGRLRQQFRIPAPGDIRNCLIALADASPMMHELFQYRFEEGRGLDGHSFGNLFLTAMSNLTGDFEQAVKESSRILAIRGMVVPVTLQHVSLGAELADHTVVDGESRISKSKSRIARVYLKPDQARATPEALAAVREADAIVMGPGSLYTSVLPNLLVTELAEEIRRARAMKFFVCNIMTQPGETTGYTVSDHLRAVEEHVGPRLFEYVVVNTEPIPAKVLERYAGEGSAPVVVDREATDRRQYTLVRARLLDSDALLRPSAGEEPAYGGVVRHDQQKLARCILKVISL